MSLKQIFCCHEYTRKSPYDFTIYFRDHYFAKGASFICLKCCKEKEKLTSQVFYQTIKI